MVYYTLVGKALRGRWNNQWTLVGKLKSNSLFLSKEEAQIAFDSAMDQILSIKNPEIDPHSLKIAEVNVPDQNFTSKSDEHRMNHGN